MSFWDIIKKILPNFENINFKISDKFVIDIKIANKTYQYNYDLPPEDRPKKLDGIFTTYEWENEFAKRLEKIEQERQLSAQPEEIQAKTIASTSVATTKGILDHELRNSSVFNQGAAGEAVILTEIKPIADLSKKPSPHDEGEGM